MAERLAAEIRACRRCADRFAATATAHAPNPVVWFRPGARILIASQAPGLRVHRAERPFWDLSGRRLREWLAMSEAEFYDRDRVAVLPTAFCFPGYDAKGADLPPPPVCWETWHARALAAIGEVRLRVIVGGAAQKRHLGTRAGVTETVRDWRAHAPGTFVLPHPSWRNNAWLKKNPWFEAELLPELRAAVRAALA
ncbi:uracil-DNA glycosylase family protein [Rhodosalinus sediminis]|uniref:uracil-DNA glycosylase family protein n=1 Tax=Rhodosalinus sediminis TaxID=1940533 RepID=UPI0023546E75|nr:uracil-DNA glycosylase family protein [Rhodosalinus sediminis]